MPAVYLFGKRTLWGGDDLQLPALFTMLVRILQIGLFVAPISYWSYQQAETTTTTGSTILDHILVDYNDSAPCRHSHFFPLLTSMYLMATTIFGLVSLVLEYRIFYWTCQGRPTQRQPRTQKMETLLEWKLFVLTIFLVIIVFTYGTAQVFAKSYRLCLKEQQHDNGRSDVDMVLVVGSHKWWAVSSLLIASQVAEIALAVLFWIRLWQTPFAVYDRPNPESFLTASHHQHHELAEELWEDRCHSLCQCLSLTTCCLFGGHDLYQQQQRNRTNGNYYEHVARALADYLETGGTLDVVPTDILAGLLMLQRLQRQRVLQARLQVRRSSSRIVTTPDAVALLRGNSSDIAIPAPSNQGLAPPLKLRSRSTSTNDLVASSSSSSSSSSSPGSVGNNNNNIAAAPMSTGSRPFPLGMTQNSSANSIDLPETTRLVDDETKPPAGRTKLSQRIYRRTYRRSNSTTASASATTTSPLSNSNYYHAENRKVLNPFNPVDCQRLQEGAHMAKYALCIYTWMLYVYVHPLKGIAKLMYRTMQCRSSSWSPSLRLGNDPLLQQELHSSTIKGDNWFEWNKHALLLVAGLNESDLVYAQFENRVSLMPYCILLDHAQQGIVVSVRGSLSLEDLVTDVHVDPEPVQTLGAQYGFDATNQYCHAGVVACAQNIYDDVQRRLGYLQTAYPEYQLRLCGHSLGAAICTLMGYMLRPKFPTLQVFNYSPPGCTMTWELATQCEPWTTTFILDSDIVPRLSVAALEDLRDEILQLVGRLKVPKYHIVQSFMNPNYKKWCDRNREYEPELQELSRSIDELLDDEPPTGTLYQRQVAEFLKVQEQRKQSRGASRRLKMYPPGRMIHLVKTGETGGCGNLVRKCMTCGTTNSGFQYTPVYVANDDLDEIVVTPTMATDHFVDRMVDELAWLAEDYSNSATLSPETTADGSGSLV